RTLFITPVSMDPNNSQILVAGTYKIYRTINGAGNWTSISPDLSGDGYSYVSAVTVAKGNSNIIYAAYTNGKIWITQQADTNWTEIDQVSSNGTPRAWCTSLTTNPTTDDGTVYATYSGYLLGDKVFKSTNYGQTWTNVSGNLPNIPVECLVVNPNNLQNLIIGTDLGIFTSFDGGASWTQDNSGLANVAVFDLDYRASDNTIFAATHGRGMFSAPLTITGVQNTNSNIPTTFHVSQNYPNPFNPSTIIQYSLPQANKVKIVVYDISGKEIALLADNFQNAGTYNVTWTGKNNSGQQVASGIYFYTVQAGNFSQTNKMVLLK
ncbi:MAG TPA: FlgD immunoglobulin-like domain containing protein, partial [Ignavibacteriaceae bacterium]|nr:FlgD immunoglobulin-like domain containing protein [Ignavibacteriaceae bacterium]